LKFSETDRAQVIDIWENNLIGIFVGEFKAEVPAHGTGMFKIELVHGKEKLYEER